MDRNMRDIVEIRDCGGILRLSDGSTFRVDPFDLPEVNRWSTNSEIELAETRDCVFNYTLTNRDMDAWIRATKLPQHN